MGGLETVLFAFFSFIFLIFCFMALMGRKHLAEAVTGLCVTLFALISAYNFRLALIDSGKNPAFLGFYRYPFVFPVYVVFTAAGIVLMIHGMVRFRNRAKT